MIIRGTTPTMTFNLPFNADMLDTGYVVIRQNKQTVVEKKLEECECGGTTVSAKFTQVETLKLTTEVNAEINLVIKTLEGGIHDTLLHHRSKCRAWPGGTN